MSKTKILTALAKAKQYGVYYSDNGISVFNTNIFEKAIGYCQKSKVSLYVGKHYVANNTSGKQCVKVEPIYYNLCKIGRKLSVNPY